eukprot:SAG11_NODE_1364_length_5109_cov_2.966866_3_plen_71_part_00
MGQTVCLSDGEWIEMVREEVNRERSVSRRKLEEAAVAKMKAEAELGHRQAPSTGFPCAKQAQKNNHGTRY